MFRAVSRLVKSLPSSRRRALRRQIWEIQQAYHQELVSAPAERHDQIIAVMFGELAEPEAELDQLETDERLMKAHFWGIVIPDTAAWWERSPLNYGKTLTDQGMVGVDRIIRDERRAAIKWWVEVVTQVGSVVIGVIGAVIALRSMK